MSDTPHPIVYLAAPYSHDDAAIRLWRYKMVTAAAAQLIRGGAVVFSPITMTHPIDLLLSRRGSTMGSDYWINFDASFMQFCAEIAVLKLEGWQDSQGIRREIAFFEANNRPVRYIDPQDVALPSLKIAMKTKAKAA